MGKQILGEQVAKAFYESSLEAKKKGAVHCICDACKECEEVINILK